MDSRDNFITKMRDFLLTIDEEYLIGISNKGIVNRAKKDLDSGNKVDIQIEDTGISCTLDGDITCFVNEDIKAYKCSCPSRSICKHVVMSYLYLKNNLNTIFSCDSQETPNESKNFDFTKFLSIEREKLIEAAGEKLFNEAIKRIKFGVEVKIEESSILTIRFEDENLNIKIMPNSREDVSVKEILEESMCSCKEKEICRHKIEAIIQYQLYKKIIKEEDLKICNKKYDSNKKVYLEGTTAVKNLMKDILFIGLSRMSETTLEKLESTALLCHNYDIPNLEKMLRTIRSELELYIKKNASFSTKILRNKISYIYAAATAIEICTDKDKLYKLCGEHKSSYYDIPTVKLYGIGAEKWESKSGYEGVTYYYYEEKKGQLFTYTNSRPTYYDNNKKRNLPSAYSYLPNWNIEGRIEDLSQYAIKLMNGKINDENRISSSEQSRGELLEKTDIHKLNLKDIYVDKWYKLLEGYEKVFMDRERETSNIYIIKPEEYGKSSFDNIKQRFTVPLYDSEGSEINLMLDFSKERKSIIQKFERMERSNKYPDSILVRSYIIDEKLMVIPIVLYYDDGDIVNLTLHGKNL